MKYLVLISKGEWFDKGTEVFDACAYEDRNMPIRITPEDYAERWGTSGQILGLGKRNGDWDEELCPMDEFDIAYTDSQVTYEEQNG